jgi:hypothetical protein
MQGKINQHGASGSLKPDLNATGGDDTRIGGAIKVGVVIGVSLNLTQAEKAADKVSTSLRNGATYLLNKFVTGGLDGLQP